LDLQGIVSRASRADVVVVPVGLRGSIPDHEAADNAPGAAFAARMDAVACFEPDELLLGRFDGQRVRVWFRRPACKPVD
jgi:hypothetical protein